MKLLALNLILCFGCINSFTELIQAISAFCIIITTAIVCIRFIHYLKDRKKEKTQSNLL